MFILAETSKDQKNLALWDLIFSHMQLVEEICGGSCFVWQRQVDVTRIVGDNHRLGPEKLGLH